MKEKCTNKQRGLAQGSAAAPFLADFTLYMLDLQYHAAFPYTWHGRYLDDILLMIPANEEPEVHVLALQQLYRSNNQLITVQHAGTEGFVAWLGFEIHPEGHHRVYVKPTWVNLFSPLYDSISPRLHIGYLLSMVIRFIIFTSDNDYFIQIWERFCEGLPARGYPPSIQQCVIDKITRAKGFNPTTFIGHHHLKLTFGYWLRQTKTWRKINHSQSPYIELWQGTLYSSELLHINQVLACDVIGDRPTIRASPTWTITTCPRHTRVDTPAFVPTVPVIAAPSPNPPSEATDISANSVLGSAHSIDSDDSNINGPDWFNNRTRLNIMPINLAWHDIITTQFRGRVPGGAGADDIEHPLRVGAPIPGTNSDLLLASPLSTVLREKSNYKPLLLEEPRVAELEALRPVFFGQIIAIASWLYDYQIVPSYRDAWLPKGLIEDYPHTPDSMAATTLDITLLMHTHRESASTELKLLHDELMNLYVDCGNFEETEGPIPATVHPHRNSRASESPTMPDAP